MKKKLEADLMSIAHRVLQMKNKSDVNQLYVETQKLYEKLSVLRFVEEHFEGPKPTIGQAEVVAKMKQFFEENHLTEEKPTYTTIQIVDDHLEKDTVVEAEIIVEKSQPLPVEAIEIESENSPSESEAKLKETAVNAAQDLTTNEVATVNEVGFLPAFELDAPAQSITDTPEKSESFQISFEDILGIDYTETQFVRVDNVPSNALDFELPKIVQVQNENENIVGDNISNPIDNQIKTAVTMERLATGLNIGLNDRIAFVKHLFGNSDEDYNRVLNQLITFDNFDEAKNFIEDMVKPDYNDWQGKEDYEQRFIENIEKKFA